MKHILIVIILIISISACSPGQVFGPTKTPTSTITFIPSPTLTPTPTSTPTPTFTSTPTFTLTPIPTNIPISATTFDQIKCEQQLTGVGKSISDLDSAFSPDGNYFAVGQVSSDNSSYYINIYNVADWTIAHKINTEDYIYSVDFSPDGKTLLSSSKNGKGQLWNVFDGSLIKSFPSSGPIRFSPDGSTIAFGYMDKLLHLWNIQDEKDIIEPIHLPLFVWDKIFSPDGKYIFVTTSGAYVRIFDPLTGKFISMLDTKSPRGVSAMAISPNGKLLITAGLDNNQINWWNTGTWSSMFTEKGHGRWVTGLAFSPDGSLLVSGNNNGTIEFWDPTNGEHLTTIQAVDDWASVKFTPKGEQLLVIAYGGGNRLGDGSICVWRGPEFR